MEIWNNDYNAKYGVPNSTPGEIFNSGVAGWADAFHSYTIFGDSNASTNLFDEVLGINSQKREFAQQEYLQDKMNAYNTPAAQLARMKEAGINPNLAASGIAQSGSESAQAPAVASNTQGAAAGLSAVGSAIGGVAGAALTAAQKRNLDASSNEMNANAGRTNALVDFEIEKMRAETAKTWTDNGMDSAQADYWSTKAFYADKQERLDIAGKAWSIKKAQKEVGLLDEEIKIAKQDLEYKKLQYSEEEYRVEQIRIQTEFEKRKEEILKKYGIDVNLPEDGMLLEAYDYGTLDSLLSAFYSNHYQAANAAFQAEIDTISQKIEEEIKGQFKVLEKNVELQKELMKYGVASDATSTVIQTILKYVFGTGFSVNVKGVGVTNNETTR